MNPDLKKVLGEVMYGGMESSLGILHKHIQKSQASDDHHVQALCEGSILLMKLIYQQHEEIMRLRREVDMIMTPSSYHTHE